MDVRNVPSIGKSISFGFSEVMKYVELMIIVFLYSFVAYYDDYIAFLYSGYAFHLSLRFSIPWAFPTLGDFYDFPKVYNVPPLQFHSLLPSALGWAFFPYTVLVFIVINSVIMSGFLGKIYYESILKEKGSFSASINKYFIRIFAFEGLVIALVIVEALITLVNPAIGLIGIFFLLFVMYLLFLTPFIIVADDISFVEALRKSISVALTGSVISYVIIFAILTAVFSVLISFLMMIIWIGFGVALSIVTFVGTAMTISTFHYYTSLKAQYT